MDSTEVLGQTGLQPAAAVAAQQTTNGHLNASSPVDDQGLRQLGNVPVGYSDQSDQAAGGMSEQHELQTQQRLCKQTHISQIKCWLDTDGYIAGLAFETEAGISAPALCQADGLVTDGVMLDKGEVIVEVVSCR